MAVFILSQRYMYIHVRQSKKEEKSWWCRFSILPNMRQPEDLTNFHFASCALRGQSQIAWRTRALQLHPQIDPQKWMVCLRMHRRSCFKCRELTGLLDNSDTDIVFLRYFSYGQQTYFWQNSSTWVAGLYFKDIILNIIEQLQSWEELLSLQEHGQQLSHQISCFWCCSSLSALSRNEAIHLFLFSSVIHIFFLSQHKKCKNKPSVFFCLLSYSVLRCLWSQLLLISDLQSCCHQRTV